MRSRPLPRNWKRRAWPMIADEADLRVTDHSRLRAKMLIFHNRLGMRSFWRRINPGDRLPVNCFGVVNQLCTYIDTIDSDGAVTNRRMGYRDPRYFCVIGLTKTHLSTVHVMHEICHAAFAYHKRVKGIPWANVDSCDEESICYPMGLLARQATVFLHERGYWK